jgi:hypothetical protein
MRADLEALVERQAGPCVSIYQPTHRAGPDTRRYAQQDPIRLKNLLREAGQRLATGGDSERLAELFDENDEAVTTLIRHAIEAAHSRGRKVGLCGQMPSDRPEFARFLVEAGIDSMSVSPDTFLRVKRHVAAAEGGGTRDMGET